MAAISRWLVANSLTMHVTLAGAVIYRPWSKERVDRAKAKDRAKSQGFMLLMPAT